MNPISQDLSRGGRRSFSVPDASSKYLLGLVSTCHQSRGLWTCMLTGISGLNPHHISSLVLEKHRLGNVNVFSPPCQIPLENEPRSFCPKGWQFFRINTGWRDCLDECHSFSGLCRDLKVTAGVEGYLGVRGSVHLKTTSRGCLGGSVG